MLKQVFTKAKTFYSVRILYIIFCVFLIIAGQLYIFKPKTFNFNFEFIENMSKNIFPPNIFFGVLLVLLGTILSAIPLSFINKKQKDLYPSSNKKKTGFVLKESVKSQLYKSPRIIISLNLSILFTLLTVILLLFNYNDNNASVAWLFMIISAAYMFYRIDKTRGKNLALPAFSKVELIFMAVLCLCTLVYLSIDCMNWHWIGISDETCSIGAINNIVDKGIQSSIFSEDGGFYAQPMLLVIYQSIFVKLFGYSIFAYRISSVLLTVISVPFLYYFARELWNKYVAVIASVLFAFTPLVIVYSHFSYGMTIIYPSICVTLAVFAWSIKKKSLMGYFLSGCLGGIFFYTAYPARLVPILRVILGLLLGVLPILKKGRIAAISLGAGTILALLPWLIRINENLKVLSQFFVFSKPETAEQGMQFGKLISKFFLSIVHPIQYTPAFPGHFLENRLYEPIAAILFFIGFWICIIEFQKHRQNIFLVISYVTYNLFSGTLSNQSRPSDTRLLALAPFVAIIAAIAVTRILQLKSSPQMPKTAIDSIEITDAQSSGVIENKSTGSSKRILLIKNAVLVLILAASITSTLIVINEYVFVRNHGYGDGSTAEIVRLCENKPKNTNIVFIQRGNTGNGEINIWLGLFGFKNSWFYLAGKNNTEQERAFSDSIEKIKSIQPPFIVAHRLVEPEYLDILQRTMSQKYPDGKWSQTDPGKSWSVSYFEVK